jgi:hypothetical protein
VAVIPRTLTGAGVILGAGITKQVIGSRAKEDVQTPD